MFQRVDVGDTLEFTSSVLKVGLNLGFTEMIATNDKGEIVARVSHIKYVQMGIG